MKILRLRPILFVSVPVVFLIVLAVLKQVRDRAHCSCNVSVEHISIAGQAQTALYVTTSLDCSASPTSAWPRNGIDEEKPPIQIVSATIEDSNGQKISAIETRNHQFGIQDDVRDDGCNITHNSILTPQRNPNLVRGGYLTLQVRAAGIKNPLYTYWQDEIRVSIPPYPQRRTINLKSLWYFNLNSNPNPKRTPDLFR